MCRTRERGTSVPLDGVAVGYPYRRLRRGRTLKGAPVHHLFLPSTATDSGWRIAATTRPNFDLMSAFRRQRWWEVAPLHAAWQDQRRHARQRGKVPLEWEGRGASALGLMGMNNNEPRKAIRAPPSRAGAGNTPATRLACHDRSLPALLRGGTALPRGVPSAIEKR